jgi:hypothetical protein
MQALTVSKTPERKVPLQQANGEAQKEDKNAQDGDGYGTGFEV